MFSFQYIRKNKNGVANSVHKWQHRIIE